MLQCSTGTQPLTFNEAFSDRLSLTDLGLMDFYILERTPAHQEMLGC